MDALFAAMLALLDMVFFVFAFSLLAIAAMSAVALFYAIRAFNRSESRMRKEALTRE